MKLSDIQKILTAKCCTDHDLENRSASTACGADLLSDVLAFAKSNSLLLTGLIHPQVIRTAEMLDIVAVVLVRGKEPTGEMVDMARKMDIPVLSTSHTMYESCGLLFTAGLNNDKVLEGQ